MLCGVKIMGERVHGKMNMQEDGWLDGELHREMNEGRA